MLVRRLSLPPPEAASIEPSSSPSALTDLSSPPSNGSPPCQPNSQPTKLLSRAEVLAKMTFELNLRAVSQQTDRLQRDMQALVQSTAEDKEFRAQNETRLEKLWQEMLAVKQHMSKVEHVQTDNSQLATDFEKCQRETQALVDEFRTEIGELKVLIVGLSKHVDELPGATEARNESGYSSQQNGSLDFGDLSPTQPIERQASVDGLDGWGDGETKHSAKELVNEGHDLRAVADASQRIIAAIQSTKRWNREHKATKLGDDEFSANYLKQQSKRDTKLAVYIQRAILRRIRWRRQRTASRPKSLEEFCKDVKWEDVIGTVQDVLMDKEKTTILALIGA